MLIVRQALQVTRSFSEKLTASGLGMAEELCPALFIPHPNTEQQCHHTLASL